MKELISVIVPVYKVEKYLGKCVDYLINQTYSNLEIILIDDGSPDGCPALCDAYAKRDKRIKVIHKENGGLSDARNEGMKIATGDYISFIDSDDWIDTDAYQLMMDIMIRYDADIVECNFNYVYEHEIKEKQVNYSKKIFNTEEALSNLISGRIFQSVVWNKIYKRKCMVGIDFEIGKINEDEFWTYQVFARAKKIVFINKALYYYLQRNTSIMGNYSLKHLDNVEGMFNRMCFMEKYYPSLHLISKLFFYRACIYHYQMILKNKEVDVDKLGKKLLCEYRNRIKFSIKDLNYCSLKEKVFIVLSRMSMDLCCRARNIIGVGM